MRVFTEEPDLVLPGFTSGDCHNYGPREPRDGDDEHEAPRSGAAVRDDLEPERDDPPPLSAAELSELNLAPVGFLATLGVRCGAYPHRAFEEAQQLVEAHGSSRCIDPANALLLCARMRAWSRTEGRRLTG